MSRAQELASLRPGLLRFAMLRLRNREQAEDAVQDTLLAALEGIESFSGSSSLRTWVGGILKHKITDCLRARGREEPMEFDEVVMPESDPEERFFRGRFLEAVQRSLDHLPANAARVFMLREVMGLDPAEVCDSLGMSLSNCWVSLHRAKARLRVLVPNEV